uniref:Uncharacterized protein n=1 Tax=Ananas comosus var. bracteatus TaxID=296719 RepID=A0A6V7NMN0_ANACO|nr:unnamed protein product [Ananas comosus var. bracteatus]
MATAQSHAVKCLNTSTGGKRFVFKSFYQRVEEIDIDVFRSLEPVKLEPSSGSSFFRESLLQWRELNTAEDFISFYEKMMPLVQTLPQIILHRELIFSELLKRLNMKARLSLEPILMLIASFSRDVLEEFLPLLQRLTNSLVDLLTNGGDRDPEVLEQVFTSWSYIMMYLQKYLVKDVRHILIITAQLRFYPKDYVREFMAEAVSFVLRNSPINQLYKGLTKVVKEVAKTPSPARKGGVTALLWHVMKGTSSRLHSRAEKVFRCFKSFAGSEAVYEVRTGVVSRLCSEVDQKELKLMHNCLLKETFNCIDDGCSEHLNEMLGLLKFAVQKSSRKQVLDTETMFRLVQLLIEKYMMAADARELENKFSEVVSSILGLMLCLLDVPLISTDLMRISLLYTPAFQLRSSSLVTFVKELLTKDPQILHVFNSHIMSAMDNFVEASPEEVLFVLLTFFERQGSDSIIREPEDKVKKLCRFFKMKLCQWNELLNGVEASGNRADMQVSVSEVGILWGVLSCYPHFQNLKDDLQSIKNLIAHLDCLLQAEGGTDSIGGLSRSTWQSLIGVALTSFRKLLMVNNLGSLETSLVLSLAKKYRTSPHVLSAVADFWDSVLGEKFSSQSVLQEFNVQNALDSFCIFADNLSMPNKEVRVSTLRILSHYAPLEQQLPTGDEPPNKKLKTEDSGSGKEDAKHTNVVELLLQVESLPLSTSTDRSITILISRIQTSLYFGKINNDYIPLLLNGIIGILYNRLSSLWKPALECLALLISKYKDLVWNRFIQYLGTLQSKSLSSEDHLMKLNREAPQPISLFECFDLYLVPDSDCTPCMTVTVSLLQSLQKIPEIAESRSRQLIPLFLNFMGYTDEDAISVESYISKKCKGKDWRMVLKEWLNLLRLMRNARSLYCNKVLKEVLMIRLLDETDPDVQLKVLDCLLNWKDDFLVPYEQHLKNLVIAKNLREELTTWAVSKDLQSIQEDYRGHLVSLIIRVLTPKVRKLKTLGSRKHAGVSHRKAILRFFSQFDVNELQLFFYLLLKPLVPRSLLIEVSDSLTTSMFDNFIDKFLSYIAKVATLTTTDDISWKRIDGFLHVVEDILGTFDLMHVGPFLNPFLMIVVRILEMCKWNLASKNSGNTYPRGDNSGNLEVHKDNTLAPGSLMINISNDQVKDLRSLCLKVISSTLNKHDTHDFSSEFWHIFFTSVKPLLDNFKQEGASSEKPSSLFSCFIAMSQSPTLVPLLGRETNLISAIFSILTVRTASDAILSSVLDFIENLLKLDKDLDSEGSDTVKRILEPHVEVLVSSFRDLYQTRREFHRKSTIWPGQRELRIFKLLVKYIRDPVSADYFLDILLPFLRKKDLNSDECLEGLQVVKGIVAVLGHEAFEKVLQAIHPLLVTAELGLRLCICDILDGLALRDPSYAFLATLLRDLNAVSSSELGELDYDARIKAYDTVRQELFPELREEHAVAILSHCVWDMSSEELIFRQSASRALHSFLQFATSILGSAESIISSIWTKASIQRILEKTYLHSMGDAMSKDISIQKEWITLLREMVFNFEQVPSLSSFKPLCSTDPEVDFFNNITHLQIHRRSRALSRFRNVITAGNFSEDLTMKIFVPLFFNMLFDVKDGKGEHLRNACVETLASVAGQLQWESYRTILMRCFRELSVKQDKQKILLRLICAVLHVFHFFDSHSNNGVKDSGVEGDFHLCSSSSQNVSPEKQQYLQKVLLPLVQKLLVSDPEKVNVNISLVALKVLKLLPTDILDSQLSSIIHRICNFLKNRLESIRDEARSALAACLKELGVEYLQLVVKILQAILKRGYELHVLGYTLNFILSKTLTEGSTGKIDYCLAELISVVESDILGDVAEEKEVDKIASKMKETRKKKSFETLKLIAQSITVRTHALKLLSPIAAHLQKHLTPKMKKRLEMMLNYIALGIECNPSAGNKELFVFAYGLIEDTVTEQSSNGKEASSDEISNRTTFLVLGDNGLRNSHLITEFSLGLLRNRLKKMKLDKKDEQLLSMLDPFVKLFGECLNSKYEDVLSSAIRCLATLIRLPLPSLEAQAEKMKNILFDIARKYGNSKNTLLQSCLKLLTNLLQSCRISLSNNQLHMLIQFPVFVDLETNPSPIALSLLKSIVSRKLVVPEIYDIVVKVSELMVTSQSEAIRKKSSQILLQFLLDYELSNKRLQQHMDFLLTNLSYEHSSGREAVLEMIHALLVKSPESLIENQAQTFFVRLVLSLANDHEHKVQSMVGTVIKVLIGRLCHLRANPRALDPILEYSLAWYTGEKQQLSGEKQQLWSAAAQVLGLLVEVLKKGFNKHINRVLSVAKHILESSILASSDVVLDFSNEAGVPFYKEAYYSLVMLEKILQHFPEMYFDRKFEDLWALICKFLLHPHMWLRRISSRLVALYFAAVSEAGRTNNETIKSGALFLVNPSRLFLLAVSFVSQLRTELSDEAANNLIAQNIVFSICGLHSFAKQRKLSALHQFWSTLSSDEQGLYLKGFELLASRKAQDQFLLCTTTTSVSLVGEDQIIHEAREDLKSLLVAPLLKKMGKIAMQMEDAQMKIVFNCFKMISLQLGSGDSLAYAPQMLFPLYKVCEGFAGKIVGDEIKQLAEEVRDSVRDVLGVDNFVQVYNMIRKNLKQKREKRKQSQKLVAVVNPMRHAKRKLQIAVKHRAHKKRKIAAMKAGTWKR